MTVARAWSCASRTSWVVTVAQTDYIQPLALGTTGDFQGRQTHSGFRPVFTPPTSMITGNSEVLTDLT